MGQDEAVKIVSEAVRRSRVGLKNPTRPTAVLLFMGPTGVGKTELAKVLTELVFGDESAMLRLDMSEFMEKHSVAKLIGSPPGYVGYEEGGQLTEKVRRQPYSLILLDEIEKAHPDVLNILLQLFDEGRLTDSKGRTIDFKNTIIIMTSNLGAELIINTLNKISKSPIKSAPVTAQNLTESKIIKMKSKNNDDNSDANKAWDEMMTEMNAVIKKSFKPEFVNRIDEIVVFKALSIKEVENIVRLMLEKTSRLLNAQKISVEYSEDAVKEIAKIGYDPQYGARPLQRIIRRYIENPLSEKILSEEVSENDKVLVGFKNGVFTFNKK